MTAAAATGNAQTCARPACDLLLADQPDDVGSMVVVPFQLPPDCILRGGLYVTQHSPGDFSESRRAISSLAALLQSLLQHHMQHGGLLAQSFERESQLLGGGSCRVRPDIPASAAVCCTAASRCSHGISCAFNSTMHVCAKPQVLIVLVLLPACCVSLVTCGLYYFCYLRAECCVTFVACVLCAVLLL
jgi:hypothetical protein